MFAVCSSLCIQDSNRDGSRNGKTRSHICLFYLLHIALLLVQLLLKQISRYFRVHAVLQLSAM